MLKIQVSATSKKDEEAVMALINAIGYALEDDYSVEIKQKGFHIEDDGYYAGDDTYFALAEKKIVLEKI